MLDEALDDSQDDNDGSVLMSPPTKPQGKSSKSWNMITKGLFQICYRIFSLKIQVPSCCLTPIFRCVY